MKRVIVTGANGFVGSNIVAALLEQGCFVCAVDLQFDNPVVKTWSADQIVFMPSSCTDLPALQADALVHAAFITASPAERKESPEANLQANINPMLAMMSYAEQHDIKRSIFVSSSAVYRNTPDMVIDERYPQTPLGTYAVAKTLMEQFIETLHTVHGRDICCVRLGNIFGKHEYRRVSRPFLSIIGGMLHSARHKQKVMLQHPDETREWTYAHDIGAAIYALLTTKTLNHALYNVAAGIYKSNQQLAEMIQNIKPGTEIITENNPQRPTLTRLATLDNSRLRADTEFDDWTALDENTLKDIMNTLPRSAAYA